LSLYIQAEVLLVREPTERNQTLLAANSFVKQLQAQQTVHPTLLIQTKVSPGTGG